MKRVWYTPVRCLSNKASGGMAPGGKGNKTANKDFPVSPKPIQAHVFIIVSAGGRVVETGKEKGPLNCGSFCILTFP